MALPMVHLAVAHEMVCSYSFQPVPAFYLGSIAPDAIHPVRGLPVRLLDRELQYHQIVGRVKRSVLRARAARSSPARRQRPWHHR